MAPIEPDLSNSNVKPSLVVAGDILLASGLTYFVGKYVLFKAYTSIPVSQDTRARLEARRKHLIVFGLLSVASLLLAVLSAASTVSLSYRTWAYEMGESVPEHIWGENSLFGGQGHEPTGLVLGRWYHDTPFLRETAEFLASNGTRYWWTQQVLMGLISWSVFLGVEGMHFNIIHYLVVITYALTSPQTFFTDGCLGRRRNIPHVWAFMLIAQVLSLSFAMSLFFMAVLLAPVSLPARYESDHIHTKKPSQSKRSRRGSAPSKNMTMLESWRQTSASFMHKFGHFLPPRPSQPHPAEWSPHPIAILLPIIGAYSMTFLLPYATSDPLFVPFIAILHGLVFVPIYPHRLLPYAFGHIGGRGSTLAIFRTTAYLSFLLHIKQTVSSFIDNDPGTHRYNSYMSYLSLQKRTHKLNAFQRTTNVLQNLLGAIGNHPAVVAVGWDSILCALALISWSVIRGMDAVELTRYSGLNPYAKPGATSLSQDFASRAKSSSSKASPSPRNLRKRNTRTTHDEDEGFEEMNDRTSSHEIRGEEDLEEDLESGAVSWLIYCLGGLGLVSAGVLGAEVDV